MGEEPTHRQSKQFRYLLYMLLISFMSALVVSIAGIVYTGYANEKYNRENNQQWCEFLIPIDDAFRTSPAPASEFGRKIGEAAGNLRTKFEC